SVKCSSPSASLPGGLPFSLMTNLTMTVSFTVLVVAILSSSGTVLWWFLRDLRNPTARSLEDVRSRRGVEAPDHCRRRDRRSLPGAICDGPPPLAKRRRPAGTEQSEDQWRTLNHGVVRRANSFPALVMPRSGTPTMAKGAFR